MAKKKGMKLGAWAFIIGLVLAVILAIFGAVTTPEWAVITLAALGVVVGLLNVTDKETVPFLVATLAFLLSFQSLSAVIETMALGWEGVGVFFNLITTFIAPAAAIVAVIALFKLIKD